MTDEKVIERVRKLMALATSSNEHEAAAAAAKAQELMLKYNLQMAQLEEKPEDVAVQNYFDKDGSATWRKQLMATIAKTCLCRIVIGEAWGAKGRKWILFGEPANVEVALYLYEYLSGEIIRLSPRPMSTSYSNAFRHGATATIQRKLLADFKDFETATEQTTALVVVKDALVAAKVAEVFPKLGKGRGVAARDYYGYQAGRDAGQGVQIRRGISDRNTGGQFLLK